MKRRILSVLITLSLLVVMSGCKREIPIEEDETSAAVTQAANATPGAGTSTEVTEPAELVPEEGAKLKFWTGDTEFGEAVAAKFEEEYGVPVSVEEVGLGAIDKIALDGPAGNGADVFMSPYDSFQHGVTAGLFLKLDDSIAARLTERVNQVGIKSCTYQDGLYGVPVSLETSCLFYNKDIVGDQPATTLEEIIEKAKDFNDPKNNKFYFLVKVSDGYKIHPILSAFGFKLFGADGTDDNNPGLDTDEFEKGLELVASMKEIMPMDSIDLGNVSFLQSLFTEGKVAYEISGPWDIKTFKKSGVNFGVTILPTYQGNALTPFAGVQNAHVSAYSEYPIAAQLFAEYLVSDESAALMYETDQKITTLKDVSNIKGLAEDELLQAFVKQYGNSVPMPSASRMSYYWTISANICQSVFDGELTPANGRKKAVEDWNTLLTTE
jgi:arabinogalactan oligomer/maltooligosaccharide transport system substrate-binding protein